MIQRARGVDGRGVTPARLWAWVAGAAVAWVVGIALVGVFFSFGSHVSVRAVDVLLGEAYFALPLVLIVVGALLGVTGRGVLGMWVARAGVLCGAVVAVGYALYVVGLVLLPAVACGWRVARLLARAPRTRDAA